MKDPNPAKMSATMINRELDYLAIESSVLNERFIKAGRGRETAEETWRASDPLSLEWQALHKRLDDLRREISMRYGPSAPSRLPKRGFPPRER